MTMAGRIVTLVVGASVLVMLHASEGAPTPHLFPGPVFSVDMTITRFAANPANSTAVNVTLGAIMALNGSSSFLKTWHADVETTSQSMASATWTYATSNSSTVQVSWRASARDPSSRQLCFHAPLFKSQVSTVDDLSTFSAFAPLATYQGVVTWRGMTVRKYSVGSLILYSSPNASNVAVGLWDGKANEYQFTCWHSGDALVVPPPPRGCRRVSAQVTESRPSWWVAAADAAGVVAQDAGVSVVHGDDTIWCVRGVLWLAFAPSSCTATLRRMFGDSFLTKSSPACTWPGVSNTGMHVQPPTSHGQQPVAKYYTGGTTRPNAGCAWFLCPVSKALFNGPRHRRLWPTGGTTVDNSTTGAFVSFNVVDTVNPGTGVAVSNPAGPPAYSLLGVTSDGGYTSFPVNEPNLVASSPDADGFLYILDFHVPAGFSDFNRYARLARVASANVTSPAGYEFWTGRYTDAMRPLFLPQAQLNPALSPPFVYNVNNPQTSVAFSEELGMYVLATTDTSQDLYVRVSPSPTGPWSHHVPLYSHHDAHDKPGVYVYCAYFHPLLFPTAGRNMTLTFSRNGGGCGFPAACNDWWLDLSFPYDDSNAWGG